LHRTFARLHGAHFEEVSAGGEKEGQAADFTALYAAYAEATLRASALLQKHGKSSPQFATADVASMRLFHRVKKMQGLKKTSTRTDS
jgi:hypothetical protein